jgi:eukaryotic-like serine/threonine-protein kinase
MRAGGKEEIRASFLKTYLLRLRAEKGERAVRSLLAAAGIDPAAVDNETGWLSVSATKRALKLLSEQLGADALRHRGDWTTHAEALGTLVRMLRTAEQPIDAYRYLAANSKEVTRVGTWDVEEHERRPEGGTDKASVRAVVMVYRPRHDPDEAAEHVDTAGEDLLCAAREGELASYPRIWGLGDAHVVHESCVFKGGEACRYAITWTGVSPPKRGAVVGALAAAVATGGIVSLAGGALAGGIAAVLGGALGGGAGYLHDRSSVDRGARTFERNRIAALERGLELRGEHGGSAAQPGELTGTVLGGKYKIGRKIGSGGIGVVYAAEHVTLGHEVAVKVLRGAAARDGGEIARLRREAYIQVHIEHPNVARVMDLDQMPDGSIYVVMERLVGRSLADKLAREGLVAPGFAVPVFVGVCGALAAAHAKGVVHRDLKPGNVFLCDDGSAKVLDFGMSKLTAAEALTQTGYTLGTPEYMAPEQCIGAQVEARTDVYALGVLMYEALTGELPIIAASRRELLDLHQRQMPMPLRQRRPDLPIPEALDAIIMKCLRKRVSDRPKNAFEVQQSLEAIPLEGLPTSYSGSTGRRAAAVMASAPRKDDAPAPGAVPKDANTLTAIQSSASPPAAPKDAAPKP